MFLREFIFGLFVTFSLFHFILILFFSVFSLSFTFLSFRWIFVMLVQVKPVRRVLQSFCYKNKGRGEFVQQGGGGK